MNPSKSLKYHVTMIKMNKSSSTVSNPYSRRNNSASAVGTSATSSAAPTPITNSNAPKHSASSRGNARAKTKETSSSSSSSFQPIQTRTPTPTTFSQAFGDEGDDYQQRGMRELNDGASSSSAAITSTTTSTTTSVTAAPQHQQHASASAATPAGASASAIGAAATLVQPHVLLVSTKQRGNGLLRYIRNVPYTYSKIVPDYIMGPNRCALFLSLKYHNLHPNYIHRRIAELEKNFDVRLLLCLVDVDDNASLLNYLNAKVCVRNNMTLLLAWSEEECARYLESFKAFEGKDASSIQKKKETTYMEQAVDVLGSARSVNKTDVAQLLSQFGNIQSLVTVSSVEELRQCPGIGEKKVRRLYDAFHKPFSSSMAKKRKEAREERERLASIERDIADAEEGYLSMQDDFYEEDERIRNSNESNLDKT